MKNEGLIIIEENTPEGVRLNLKGRVYSINAFALEQKLDEILNKGLNNIVLNMENVEYICSTGIKIILKAFKTAIKAGGKLGIEKPSVNVSNILKITTLDEILIQ